MNLALIGKSSNMMDQMKSFTSTGYFTNIAVSGDGNLIFYKEGSGSTFPVKVRSKASGYAETGHTVSDGGIGRGYQISSDRTASNIIMVNANGSTPGSVSFYSYDISTGFTKLIDIALPSSSWYIDSGLCSMSPDGNTASAVIVDATSSYNPRVVIYKKTSGVWAQYTILTGSGNVLNFVLSSDAEGVAFSSSSSKVQRYSGLNTTPTIALDISISGLRSSAWGRGLALANNTLIAITDSEYDSGNNSSVEVRSNSGAIMFFITGQALPGSSFDKINAQVSLSADGTLLTFSTESSNPKLYLYRRDPAGSVFNFECFLTKNDSNTSGGYLVKGEAGGFPKRNLVCSLDGKVQVGIAENTSRIFVI